MLSGSIWRDIAALAPVVDQMAAIAKHAPLTVYTFALGAVVLYVWSVLTRKERASLGDFLKFTFPKAGWISHSSRVDIGLFLLSKVTQKVISLIGLFLIATGVAAIVGALGPAPMSAAPAGAAVVFVFAVTVFVLSDLGEFLSHYLQHRVPALWEFHKVHHSARFLSPFTTQRFHPIGNLIDTLFISFCAVPPAVIAQRLYNIPLTKLFGADGVIELVCAIVLLRHLQHTHFRVSFGPLERLFISPLMHQVHHSVKIDHWDKNFGSRLAVWDWMAGTAFILPRDEPLEFGIGTVEDARGNYQTIVACYVRPMVQSARILRDVVRPRRTEQKAEV